jgi:alkylation response protein AidB-like acyl-CoA dehydrogenase
MTGTVTSTLNAAGTREDEEVEALLHRMDAFIEREIVPIEAANPEFFDHRREFSRTDVARGGVPSHQWHELMREARRRADAAGFYRFPLPVELGGQNGSLYAMARIREHLTRRGPGLHAELTHEASIVANLPLALVLHKYGTEEQKRNYLEPLVSGEIEMAFGLTEPNHGSDATHLETVARREGDDWVIDGVKRWNSGMDVAAVDLIFARTSGRPGSAAGITAFLVPTDTPGLNVDMFHWTLNMPTDHAEVSLDGVRVPHAAVLGEVDRGLDCAQLFLHENRIRQAASSLGAAQFCIERSIRFVQERVIFGKPLVDYQGIQWQLVELQTDAELIRNTLYLTSRLMDQLGHSAVSDRVSMVNYRGNQLACRAADRAMQIHGGMGYSRHLPFEFIYRHHRRYRITEGTDEVQMRRIASTMFDFAHLKRTAATATAIS